MKYYLSLVIKSSTTLPEVERIKIFGTKEEAIDYNNNSIREFLRTGYMICSYLAEDGSCKLETTGYKVNILVKEIEIN